MTVDLSKIRPGDEVTVRLVVVADNLGHTSTIRVAVPNAAGSNEVTLAGRAIVSHTPTPEPLAIGDRVKWANTRGTWEIAAIRDVWAWLADPMDKGIIVALSDLERVP